MYDVIVIGGGFVGLMVCVVVVEYGVFVFLLDKGD